MPQTTPDIIFHNARITTLDRSQPAASAVAIQDGKFVAVGTDTGMLARHTSVLARNFKPGGDAPAQPNGPRVY